MNEEYKWFPCRYKSDEQFRRDYNGKHLKYESSRTGKIYSGTAYIGSNGVIVFQDGDWKGLPFGLFPYERTWFYLAKTREIKL